ncbi:hypothetical protein LVJ94_20805 [Pendulispora rubella]|uniref:Uncharacterized protein n=1 Tax=Pendulispora rubella TaxID=2741070 RepID=A0ABZ2LLD9_9BACT
MRWRFQDPNDAREAAERASVRAKIDAWWRAFGEVSGEVSARFTKGGAFDVLAFMQTYLQPIDANLMWEFGPARKATNRHRLVMTPESRRFLRPLVSEILERAPSLPQWEFYPYRLAEELTDAVRTVEGRANVDVTPFEVDVHRGELHAVDLTWLIPPGIDRNVARGAAFVATETILGEEMLDTWIGEISVEVRPRPGLFARMFGGSNGSSTADRSIGSLRTRVESAIELVRNGLPTAPRALLDNEGESVVFEVKPTEADDYPRQKDLFVGVSHGMKEMWQAAHMAAPFSSQRFSRHGETFCYLKLDGAEELEGSKFADRGAIEEALDAALRSRGLGIAVGGGTGLRYSYIDLALARLDEGLAEVRRVAREGRLPKRSWLLFFDDIWRDEWLGIHEDTPAPCLE